ncbi:hypothetical protein [Streptomyces armeniacus]|nr:hypothetical protein [Streptomyces armeniacus]
MDKQLEDATLEAVESADIEFVGSLEDVTHGAALAPNFESIAGLCWC